MTERVEKLKSGLESACNLQNWIEDNASDEFWESIPIEIWNNVTNAIQLARRMEQEG